MHQIKKYFAEIRRNSFFIFLNSILDRGIFFLFYIFLAHNVSRQEYGLIASVFAFTNILQAIFDLGLPFYLQREAAVAKDFKNEMNSVILLKIISIILFIPIPLIYFMYNLNTDPKIVLIISLISFLWGVSSILNAIFYGYNRFRDSSLCLLLSRAIILFAFLINFIINLSPLFILIVFVISSILHIVCFILYFRKNKIWAFQFTVNFDLIKKIIKSAFPMGLGVIFILIYDRADILILQNISGLGPVAFYSVAYSFYRSLQIFGLIFLIPKYNEFSKSYFSGKRMSLPKVKAVLITLLSSAFLIILIASVFGRDLIRIIYSPAYLYSGNIFVLLSFALPGVFMNNFTGVFLNSIRKEKIPAVTTGIGALFNIIVNILLISSIGIWGAVITTILTEYFVFLLQFLFLIHFKNKKVFVLE